MAGDAGIADLSNMAVNGRLRKMGEHRVSIAFIERPLRLIIQRLPGAQATRHAKRPRNRANSE